MHIPERLMGMSLPLMLAALGIAAPQAEKSPDRRYMQFANYIAGSRQQDPEALGGFGASDHFPQPIRDPKMLGKGPKATLTPTASGFRIHLTNGGSASAWFRAADSNLLALLEARNAQGTWQAIEFKPWYWCGNSYHRVALPSGFGWTFDVSVPRGSFKTKVRWRYSGDSNDTLVSNELSVSLPPTRFQLDPTVAAANKLELGWGLPTLVPKTDPPPGS